MARKQLGMVDDDLLARVDARAAELGQTRRVFTERALEAWLKDSEGDPAEVIERRILAQRAPAAVPSREVSPAELDALDADLAGAAFVKGDAAAHFAPVRRDVAPKPFTPPIPKGKKR